MSKLITHDKEKLETFQHLFMSLYLKKWKVSVWQCGKGSTKQLIKNITKVIPYWVSLKWMVHLYLYLGERETSRSKFPSPQLVSYSLCMFLSEGWREIVSLDLPRTIYFLVYHILSYAMWDLWTLFAPQA